MRRVRVACAQIDLVVGDLDGNASRILHAYEQAQDHDVDLVVYPELTVTGYPPEDLLLRPRFVEHAREVLDQVASRTGRAAAVVGFPELARDLHNAAAVLSDGVVHGVYRKRLLPNYGVFDEQRYFAPGDDDGPLFVIGGVRVAISICEDAWSPAGPISTQAAAGAELVVNLNGSPYAAGRLGDREAMLATRAADAAVPIVYTNLVGGQDELVFDGASLVFDPRGDLIARARQFDEDLLVVDVDVEPDSRARLLRPRARERAAPLPEVVVSGARDDVRPRARQGRVEEPFTGVREVYEALVLGTRDYAVKNGFTEALVALSGGVDSALVAVIAADALGPDAVTCVSMPSRYSSEGSVADAAALVANLGVRSLSIPIEPAHSAFETMLAPVFGGTAPGVAEENVQSRVRGTIVMALSNKSGALVLATGNKSEMATGYTTLYGDLAGGFAVIKDVPKTLVYALCHDRNERAGEPVVPVEILEKPPSAELRPDQVDADSLPPYDVLDPVLEEYVEHDRSIADLVAAGHDEALVRRVAQLVDRNEYKRRQAPPGVRVSPKAFGKDRRLPVTSRWTG